MTKTLYLTWHGATLFMSQQRCEGWSDSLLSKEACDAARQAGRAFFAQRHIQPDTFASSMSERACDTLELICLEALGGVPAYQRLKGLKDINFGIYEAKDTDLVPPVPYGSFFVKFGGESDDQVADRLRGTLAGLARSCAGESILVSTHRYACALFCRQWGEAEARLVMESPACSVLTVTYDEGTDAFSFVGLSDPQV